MPFSQKKKSRPIKPAFLALAYYAGNRCSGSFNNFSRQGVDNGTAQVKEICNAEIDEIDYVAPQIRSSNSASQSHNGDENDNSPLFS